MNRSILRGLGLLLAIVILTGCSSSRHITQRTVRINPSTADEVKVMTFNIRNKTVLDSFRRSWNKRKGMVVDTINANAADIIGLQEAEIEQVQLIQQTLPQYNKYAIGRSDGVYDGETCAILYRKDRFGVLDSGTFWFSKTPTVPGSKSWGAVWPRICTWMHLMDRHTRTGFYVYNVHMDANSQHSREMSARMLAGKIAARKTRDPFIIMGDFNMERSNPAMQHLQHLAYQTAYPRTIDAWASVHFREQEIGTRHGFRGKTSGRMIDHIRLCENIIPLDAKVDRRNYDGKYPSDHFPVVAKVLIKGTRQVTYNTPEIPIGTTTEAVPQL